MRPEAAQPSSGWTNGLPRRRPRVRRTGGSSYRCVSSRCVERSGYRVVAPALHAPAGARVRVFAPSGSGKTTLLALIRGAARPTSGGRVLLGGYDVAEVLPRLFLRADGGRVFFHSAVREALFGGRGERGGSRERTCARLLRAALDAVGLGRVALDDAASQLSGGEKQRLPLARGRISWCV